MFNVGGQYRHRRRLHARRRAIGDGELYGYEIECPRHGARFDIRTGAVTRMPAVVPVKWFPTRVEGDEIQVGLDD